MVILTSIGLMIVGLIGYACCAVSTRMSAEEERRKWRESQERWIKGDFENLKKF